MNMNHGNKFTLSECSQALLQFPFFHHLTFHQATTLVMDDFEKGTIVFLFFSCHVKIIASRFQYQIDLYLRLYP